MYFVIYHVVSLQYFYVQSDLYKDVFCHECGTKGIGKFCWNCGTKIFDPATQPFPEQRSHTEKPHSPGNNIPFQQPQHIHHHNVANNAPPKQTIPPQPQKLNPFEHSESEMFPYMFGSQSVSDLFVVFNVEASYEFATTCRTTATNS